MILTGFYGDNVVIPVDQAAEAYSRDTGVELLLPSTEDLLDLLPPDGCSYELAQDLNAWVSGLDLVTRDEITVAIEEVHCLCPSPALPSCSSWRGIIPSILPSEEEQRPSARRRFPTYSQNPRAPRLLILASQFSSPGYLLTISIGSVSWVSLSAAIAGPSPS